MGLQGLLHDYPDILIKKVERVDNRFHARFSATQRTYLYRVGSCTVHYGKPLDPNRWYTNRDLNLSAMQDATKIFLGTHDFSSFRQSADIDEVTVRTIDEFEVVQESPESMMPFSSPSELQHMKYFTFKVSSRSFMTHQVRKMIASVVDVGSGEITVDQIRMQLEACDPSILRHMAPPQGLFLYNIHYPSDGYTVYEHSDNTSLKHHRETRRHDKIFI